jgi:MOSC domain-containing protein YiiM
VASDATRLSRVAGEVRGRVVAVGASATHAFSKATRQQINLLAGQGVEGDAHCGVTVKHRSRVAQDPSQPNLRQVHLIHGELFDELAAQGFEIRPGQMGENITTRGIQLLALPVGALLRVGATAVLRLTGLRNPCGQLNGLQTGLMAAVLERTSDGRMIRKAGVMSVVVSGGVVSPGDAIAVDLPPEPHRELERV